METVLLSSKNSLRKTKGTVRAVLELHQRVERHGLIRGLIGKRRLTPDLPMQRKKAFKPLAARCIAWENRKMLHWTPAIWFVLGVAGKSGRGGALS